MAVVEHKKVENVRYIFGSPSTVKSRYNQVKRTFPEGKEYSIFAEPVFVEDTNTIIWSTDLKGSIINFSKLSPTDQAIAKRLLTNSIQTLLNAAKDFDTTELTDFIYNCIEIPSMNNVYLVRGAGQDSVVLSQWGFVSDVPGMEKGLLARIVNVKRVPMLFNVIFEDKEPAKNQKFYFEYEDNHVSHFSDADAKIQLEEVKVDDQVKTYQKEGETIIGLQNFTCYEGGRYTLVAVRYIDMVFTVLDQFDRTVAGQPFIFDYQGKQNSIISNNEGKITLPNIRVGLDVLAYQKNGEAVSNEHKFICEKGKDNILRVTVEEVAPVLLDLDMPFVVLNQEDKPVQGQIFTFDVNGKQTTLTSDAQGRITLRQVKEKSSVIAFQTKEGNRVNDQNFICEKDKENILRVVQEANPTFNMRFKVIDPKGNTVPNAQVKVQYAGKTANLVTDDEGYAVLENVTPKTEVKVMAIGEIKKK